MALPPIEFLRSYQAHGPSGGARAAAFYTFSVGQREVSVEVHNSAIMTASGNLTPAKMIVVVKDFLEHEVKRQGENLSDNLVIDETQMDLTLKRLRWASRFP